MTSRTTIKISLLVGWLGSSGAIILIAMLFLNGETRSDYFWHRILWTEFLCFLFWGSVLFYILVSTSVNGASVGLIGVAPTVTMVITTYGVLSFLVMVFHSSTFVSVYPTGVHCGLQIVLFVLTVIILAFLVISGNLGASWSGRASQRATSPRELHDLIFRHESSPKSSRSLLLKDNMRKLRESLIYSLHESDKLINSPDYQELCVEIENLCDAVYGFSKLSDQNETQLDSLNKMTIALNDKTKLISSKQVRG